MTMTTPTVARPRVPTLERKAAMRLAATEYGRFADLLRSLRPADWAKPTNCPAWDVRDMSSHLLGMAKMSASIREQNRQMKIAANRGGVFIDALTALQVEEHAGLSPEQIVAEYTRVGPKAARARRRVPGFIRRRALPIPQTVNGREETWTVGFLVDIVLTRDPWMHRIDIAEATGAELVHTAEHDGVLVDDVVQEWAKRHDHPFTLRLSGAAGGFWTVGTGGPQFEMDVLDFCSAISGRAHRDGLLSTEVPF